MPYFDRCDIVEAYYLAERFLNIGGIWWARPKTYEQIRRIGFRASPRLSFRSLSENGKEIYASLINSEPGLHPAERMIYLRGAWYTNLHQDRNRRLTNARAS